MSDPLYTPPPASDARALLTPTVIPWGLGRAVRCPSGVRSGAQVADAFLTVLTAENASDDNRFSSFFAAGALFTGGVANRINSRA